MSTVTVVEATSPQDYQQAQQLVLQYQKYIGVDLNWQGFIWIQTKHLT